MDANSDNHVPAVLWTAFLDAMRHYGDLASLLPEPHSPQLQAELARNLAMTITQGYGMVVHATPDYPDFVPFFNSMLLQAGPNPDNVYLYAPLCGQGTYRISGNRGSSYVFDLQLGASSGPGRGNWIEHPPGERLGTIEVAQLQLGPEGDFELILSAERPAGYSGDWFPLAPNADLICLRQVAYDWFKERDGWASIERLDLPVSRPRASLAEIERNLRLLGGFVGNMLGFWMGYTRKLRDSGLVNQLKLNTFSELGGMNRQCYFDGCFELAADEALILETEVPAVVHYWNLQLIDPFMNGIDLLTRQTSLNGRQALLDQDGKFRAVIALSDPGVPNWLDTGGYQQGGFVGRWNGADSSPLPTLTQVKLADLRQHLPPETPLVTPAQREEQLRRRSRAAKQRRRW